MATATKKEQTLTEIVTGLVRFSYLNVFQPKAIQQGQTPKYSVSLIIPKSDKETLAKIKKAIAQATEDGKSSKFGGKIPANMHNPLRDGDEERPEDEAYENAFFINANSNQKPGIVDKNRNPILDQADLVSGDYGRALISFYAFNTNGNKGIACGLQHLQKLKDGEALSSRTSIENAFVDDYEDEDSDLM